MSAGTPKISAARGLRASDVGRHIPAPVAQASGGKGELQTLGRFAQLVLHGEQLLLGPLPRPQDAVGVLERDRTQQRVLLVVAQCHYRASMAADASFVPSHARADLGEGGVAAGRGVVAERREAAIVGGAELGDRDVPRRLEHAIAHFLRRLDARIDRGDDADEDALLGLHVLADDLQHALAVALAGERDVEVADLQLEQARQQLGVVDVGAVRGIAVAARAGVHADALAALPPRTATARGC